MGKGTNSLNWATPAKTIEDSKMGQTTQDYNRSHDGSNQSLTKCIPCAYMTNLGCFSCHSMIPVAHEMAVSRPLQHSKITLAMEPTKIIQSRSTANDVGMHTIAGTEWTTINENYYVNENYRITLLQTGLNILEFRLLQRILQVH